MSGGAVETRRRSGNPITRVRDWWADAPHWQRWIVYVLLIIGALILPAPAIGSFMTPASDWTSVLIDPICTYVLMAIGLNIVVGMAGLLDLGYVAFFAIGGYSLAYFGTKYGWDFWATLVVGVLITAVSGLVLGAPTLRLRGDYLAIVTLGFGEIVRLTANNSDAVGGSRGIFGIPHPPPLFGLQFELDPAPYYYLMVGAITLMIIIAKRLEKSRVGRAWTAIREDEDAAELMGVPTFKFKLLAFAMGAMIGGVAGTVWAGKVIFIAPTNFPFILSATILAAVVLGGAGNIPGAMLGAFIIAWLPEFIRGVTQSEEIAQYRVMVFGAALVVIMAFRPEGLWPSRQRQAELHEGTGGMGALGAEVPGPDSQASEEVTR
ncbi:branched-chain amino acid ABC transporter permease [Actinocrispum wychmicini]|uniref:Branched-chain amino acid transport system permease protein n=1 Tax=Actinocrispum wychmicini TaxID=1213861 RepID=A0A4V6NNR5_9PSEU|nr:branched-chain amino acid ABC transporter permease [Actinocrispum wychmicini]TCO53020.1 branched-chain amino acid transport system permease protein [Actinocrispum wychmicini]